jgi:hypothetical protein
MDTPLYRRRESGEKMVAEREAAFQARYGYPSNALDSENFLTYQRLNELGDSLGIHWLTFRPLYGIRWSLRQLNALLTRQLEPARFYLIAGYKKEKRLSATEI